MTRILLGSGTPKSIEEIFEDILQTVPFLADPLSPLSASLLRAMPGTPEASKTAEYADSGDGVSWGYFEDLDGKEEVTQEQRADLMTVETIIAN